MKEELLAGVCKHLVPLSNTGKENERWKGHVFNKSQSLETVLLKLLYSLVCLSLI